MKTLKIPASELKPGDYIPGSRTTIIRVTRAGLSIPSNKVELIVQRGTNAAGLMTVQWGKSTQLTVERDEGNPNA